MKGAKGKYEPTWESLSQYEIPDWYIDAKFGIFIHWGPYCVPAFGNEWYPPRMYLRDDPAFEHHRQTWGEHSEFDIHAQRHIYSERHLHTQPNFHAQR